MHKRMGYRKTVKNKHVKQFIKFPSNTHLYFDFACPIYITYVSVTLIGSVIIDTQSILTLIEAWLTVARDSLYCAETVYYKCNIPVSGKSEAIILKKTGLENVTRFTHSDHWLCVHKITVRFCT